MIRTTIEVEGKEQWEFERNLDVALGKLGFEAKPSEDAVRFRSDLFAALRAKDIDPAKLVDEYRAIPENR